MAATTETRNGNGAVMEREARHLGEEITRQVSEILEAADREKQAHRPAVAYRVPSPGVRYYF